MLAHPLVPEFPDHASDTPGMGPSGEALHLIAVPTVVIDRHVAPPADSLTPVSDRGVYQVAKRSLDIGLAAALLLLLTPVWVTAAILIKSTSRGPILYRQTRVGKEGLPFACLKFRTMVTDAHDLRVELLALNEASGPVFKIRCDPRVTLIGRWLRISSIDELPQLINVIRGEMSLVGPRPPLPEEVAHYTDYQLGRLAVTPGLTCLWQVSGRNQIEFDRWVELDLEYIRRRGFWFDLCLIALTVPAVLSGRGAC